VKSVDECRPRPHTTKSKFGLSLQSGALEIAHADILYKIQAQVTVVDNNCPQ
jgi:hypothetical protein